MRTLLGWGRWAQLLFRRGKGGGAVAKVAAVRPLAGGRAPLIDDRLGLQTRGGAKLDQVDGTTCGSAVLVALAAWADPTETRRLDGRAGRRGAGPRPGMAVGFGGRYDARQRQVHKESTKFWPQALGTSPWGMVAWLRRHAPGAGPVPRAAGRRPQPRRPHRRHRGGERRPGGGAAGAAARGVGHPAPLLPRAVGDRRRLACLRAHQRRGPGGAARPRAAQHARWICSGSTGSPPCSCRPENAVGSPS